jgi:outer membrane protein assembly factor BamB
VATAAVPDGAAGAQAVVEGIVNVVTTAGRQRVYVVLRGPAGQDRDLTNNTAFVNVYVRRKAYERVRDWPRVGRDIQRSGTTPNHLHPSLDPDPIWQVPADGGHVVAEGKVYFGEDGRITAVDAKTGALAWRRGGSYVDDRYRPPIYHRGFVYTAEEGQAGALNARTGEPVPYGVAGWGGDVPIFAVEVIPQAEGHDAVFMYNADFLKNYEPNCVLEYPFKDPTVNGWDWMWSGYLQLDHLCDGQPLAFASDGPRGFATNAGHLAGFDVATGGPTTGDGTWGAPVAALFDVRLPAMAKTPAAPLVDSIGQVVVAGWEGSGPEGSDPTGGGQIVAVDPDDGSVNWSFATDARLDGTPVEHRGTIIAVDRSGRVYALDQITGALRWSWQPSGYAPPAVDQQGPAGQTLALSGRYLYVPHPDDRIHTLDAGDGSELSSTTFAARPYDLAIDDTNNAIYVRTLDGSLGAYPTHEPLPDECDPGPGAATPRDIERASFETDGSQLAGRGAAMERPAISADGRHVAFTRDGDYPNYWQLYVRDVETGETEALPAVDEVTEDITRSNKHFPALSADGRYLGFVAEQRNTATGEDGWLMFVLDRETGVTEPVLRNADGSAQYIGIESAWDSPPLSISGDGQTVAFASRANEIVPGDTDDAPDVFVVDRSTGERTLVSRPSDGRQVADESTAPSLSRDGRYVAFISSASLTGAPAESGSAGGGPYVHLHDRTTGQLTAVSVNRSGQVVTGYSPYVSGDGRFVTFTSSATSLIPLARRSELFPGSMDSEDPWWDGHTANVFVFDRDGAPLDLASVNDSGESMLSDEQAGPAVVSDDGQYVVFQNTGVLVKGVSTYVDPQIIARDRTAGTSVQISHDRWDVSGSGASLSPVLSADGTRIAFLSSADNLVDGDTNEARDVFVHDRGGAGAGEGPPAACPRDLEAPGFSDLSVAEGDVQPSDLEEGAPGQVEVTVHNTGELASRAAIVRLYDGDARHGTLIDEQPIAAIAPGASSRPSFAWDPVGHAGAHTLTVVVDPERAVFEQDPAYGADEAVDLAAHLANSSQATRDARLVVSVRDAGGDEVAGVFDGEAQIAPGAETVLHGTWNTRDTSPARYAVSARLLNAAGDELAGATSSFDIEPDVAAALSLEADHVSYDPDETAVIDALVTNESANDSLTGARVELSLTDAAGLPLDDWDLPAHEVMQGRSSMLSQAKPLRGLVPGTYHARGKLHAADGTTLAEAATEFVVGSSAAAGEGVRGSLSASPTDPERFSTATFDYAVTDDGNADIPGAIVRVRISDPIDGQTLKTLDAAWTITRAGPNAGSLSTTADMPEDRDYQASLHLVLPDGSERALDRAIIRVRPAPSPGSAPQPPPGGVPQPSDPISGAPQPPPDPTAGVPNGCVSIRSGERTRTTAVPGGGLVLMTVRRSDDPALPLRVTVGTRRGVTVASASYTLNGKAVPAAVPLSRLALGAPNRISAIVKLTDKRIVRVTQILTVRTCPVPRVTCRRLADGRHLKCSSSTPLRATRVNVTVVGAGGITAKGSTRVKAPKRARNGTYTLTMRASGPMTPGRYLYKQVATTRRKGERLLATRILVLT